MVSKTRLSVKGTDHKETHSREDDYSHVDPNDPGNSELLAHLQVIIQLIIGCHIYSQSPKWQLSTIQLAVTDRLRSRTVNLKMSYRQAESRNQVCPPSIPSALLERTSWTSREVRVQESLHPATEAPCGVNQ
ncbi:uncharacterized protein LOC135200990 [Macrobrachium nipponense]|uniref:uncharacterized protein LOC135200990 n=1 Tax=Macrobrachium nipponense TaxID=159736 RepID=UPI0030C7F5EE